MALAMAAGSAEAVYVAEHGQELFEAFDADDGAEPLGGAGRGGLRRRRSA